MKRYVFLTLVLLLFVGASAQNIFVKSFQPLPMDLTASSLEGKRIDQNGEVAALIKVMTTETGFVFEGGTLGIVDSQQRVGEIWVWVPRGLRKITILHQQLGGLRDYRFPVEIEAERTYEMVLTTGRVETIVQPIDNQQFLVFNITPKDAIVTVNNIPWQVVDGVAQKLVDLGEYEYRIEAPDYHPYAGRVKVSDPDNKVVLPVTLQPAFGFLKIEGDNSILSDASIYIDNANGSEALRSAVKLGSGNHKVRVAHPRYKLYEQSVTIVDNETKTLTINMNVNFSKVTLMVDDDAEIWVNDELKGIRSWTGELEIGNYTLECRKSNHRSTVVKRAITEDMNGETITLQAPTPVTGTLVVSSNPPMAKIFIDGEVRGESPLRLNNISVGKHVVRLKKDGYAPLMKTVIIEEDKTLTLNETLEPDQSMVVNVDQSIDKTHVDGDNVQESFREAALPVERFLNYVTLDFAYSFAPQISFGATFGSVKKIGWFVTAASNFGFDAMKYNETCDANGLVNGEYYYGYTGESCSTRISAMAGMVFKVAGPLYMKVGAGYGTRVKSWYTTRWGVVRSDVDSFTGVDATAGILLNLKGFALSLDAVTTNFKTVEAKIGLGYCWKRK